MSHEATMWAVKVRRISCAEARVLWHLADCHNPVFGCYPKQDYLAAACEIDVRSVRRCLDALRAKGLINWVEQREHNKRNANRYSLAFEPGFKPAEEAAQPAPEAKSLPDNLSGSDGEAGGQIGTFEPDISDSLNRTQESAIEPVREPVKEPVIERECAGERDEGEDPRRVEREFKRWYPTWPSYVSDSQPAAMKAWEALSGPERELAASMTEAYVAAVKASGRKFLCSAGVYLAEKRWEKLPKEDARQARPQLSNAYSRAWMGLHFAGLARSRRTLSFTPLEERIIAADPEKRTMLWADKCRKHGWPEVSALHERAREFKGVLVPTHIAQAAERCFDKVHVGGPVWEAWKRLHEARNWPFPPQPEKLEFVQFPAIGADEQDLDQAVERALARFWSELTTDGATDDAA